MAESSSLICFIWLLLAAIGFASADYGNADIESNWCDGTGCHVLVGETLKINCTLKPEAPHNSSLLLYFKFGSDTTFPEDYYKILSSKTIQLTINNVTKENDGLYTCYGNNTGSGDDTFYNFRRFRVGEKLKIVENCTCVSLNYANLTCDCCPDNYPVLSGYKMKWQDLTITAAEIENNCTKMPRCFGCIPSKPDLTYQVTVSGLNDWGEDIKTFNISNIEEIVKTNRVQNEAITDVNARNLTVTWAKNEDLALHNMTLNCEVMVTNQWNETIKWNVYESPNDGENTVLIISNLRPFSVHTLSIRCKPIRSIYWSDPATLTVTTLETEPEFPPQFESYRRLSEDHVIIYWNKIPPIYHNGNLTHYIIKYSESHKANDDHNWHVRRVPADRYALELNSSKSYTVQITAQNQAGESYASVLTIPSKDGDLPRNIESITSENGQLLNFTWDGTGANTYKFLWCAGNLCRQVPLSSIVLPGNQTSYVHPLVENERYSLSANYDDTLSSGMTEWICFYIYDAVPSELEISFSVVHPERGLTIEWDPLVCNVNKNRARITHYVIFYCRGNPDCFQDDIVENITLQNNNAKSHTIPNLMPYSRYSVYVGAYSTGGESLSNTMENMTLISKPDDSPSNLTLTDITSSHIEIQWEPPNLPNGPITTYQILIQPQSNNKKWTLEVNGSSTNAYVSDLDGYMNHTLSVKAINSAGRSPSSSLLQVLTPIRSPAKIARDSIEINVTDRKSMSAIVNISWGLPVPPNGPIIYYIITGLDEKGLEATMLNISGSQQQTSNHIECPEESQSVNFMIHAVVLDEFGQHLHGPKSDRIQKYLCPPGQNIGLTLGLPIGLSALLVIVALAGFVGKYFHDTSSQDLSIKIPDVDPIKFKKPFYNHGLEDDSDRINYTTIPDGFSTFQEMQTSRQNSGESSEGITPYSSCSSSTTSLSISAPKRQISNCTESTELSNCTSERGSSMGTVSTELSTSISETGSSGDGGYKRLKSIDSYSKVAGIGENSGYISDPGYHGSNEEPCDNVFLESDHDNRASPSREGPLVLPSPIFEEGRLLFPQPISIVCMSVQKNGILDPVDSFTLKNKTAHISNDMTLPRNGDVLELQQKNHNKCASSGYVSHEQFSNNSLQPPASTGSRVENGIVPMPNYVSVAQATSGNRTPLSSRSNGTNGMVPMSDLVKVNTPCEPPTSNGGNCLVPISDYVSAAQTTSGNEPPTYMGSEFGMIPMTNYVVAAEASLGNETPKSVEGDSMVPISNYVVAAKTTPVIEPLCNSVDNGNVLAAPMSDYISVANAISMDTPPTTSEEIGTVSIQNMGPMSNYVPLTQAMLEEEPQTSFENSARNNYQDRAASSNQAGASSMAEIKQSDQLGEDSYKMITKDMVEQTNDSNIELKGVEQSGKVSLLATTDYVTVEDIMGSDYLSREEDDVPSRSPSTVGAATNDCNLRYKTPNAPTSTEDVVKDSRDQIDTGFNNDDDDKGCQQIRATSNETEADVTRVDDNSGLPGNNMGYARMDSFPMNNLSSTSSSDYSFQDATDIECTRSREPSPPSNYITLSELDDESRF